MKEMLTIFTRLLDVKFQTMILYKNAIEASD